MIKLIDELNEDHSKIERFMNKLEQAIAGASFMTKLLEVEGEFIEFANEHLINHHEKEEKFLYHWMVEQNKNSDKELIKKMIDDHKFFEQKAKWIIDEIKKSKALSGESSADFGFEVSEFVKKYKEHLTRETNFIFVIAEGLNLKDADK